MTKTAVRLLKNTLILLIPFMIIFGSVRLVAIKAYLSFEYSRSDFPKDPFGFDYAQRLAYAVDNLRFVTQNLPLADLAGQKQNGAPLYNIRELKHMRDVQNIYQPAWRIWQMALILSVLCGLALNWRKENRADFASALRTGGLFTVGLVFIVGLGAIIAWQAWFLLFHQLFFAAGSWMFNFSDTLMRLFPEKFWYDGVLTVTSLCVILGSLLYWAGYRLSITNKGPLDSGEAENRYVLSPAAHHPEF